MAEGTVVFDASALLCLFNQEKGSDVVARYLDDPVICSVNLAEVWTKLIDQGRVPVSRIQHLIDQASLDVRDFTVTLAEEAGRLRLATRALGLSLGDRSCIALAQQLKAPVLTADRIWATLDIGVKVIVVR